MHYSNEERKGFLVLFLLPRLSKFFKKAAMATLLSSVDDARSSIIRLTFSTHLGKLKLRMPAYASTL